MLQRHVDHVPSSLDPSRWPLLIASLPEGTDTAMVNV
jgi:hypothetical protein